MSCTTSGALTTGGPADATLMLGNFGQADGPGLSVKDAIASPGVEPLLVNGILLRAADGTIWLCSALAASAPPRCAEPRLLVNNWVQPPDDQTFISGEGLHSAAGVRWIERMQLSAWCTPKGSRSRSLAALQVLGPRSAEAKCRSLQPWRRGVEPDASRRASRPQRRRDDRSLS